VVSRLLRRLRRSQLVAVARLVPGHEWLRDGLDALTAACAPSFEATFDVPNEVRGSVLTIRGRALMHRRGPATVDLELDGATIGRARLRLPRPAPGIHRPASLFAGFEHVVVVESSQETSLHTIDAVVSDGCGWRRHIGRRTVRVTRQMLSEAEDSGAKALRERTRRAVGAAPRPAPRAPGDTRYRVVVFAHQLDVGGGQLYLQELLRHLVPNVESCTVVSPADGGLRTELELLGADVVVTGPAAFADTAGYEGRVRELSLFLLGSSCDIVVVNTLSDFPAVDAASRLGIPTLWAIHESFEVDHWLAVRFGPGGTHPYIADRVKASLGAASRLVFESQATSEMFARYASAGRRVVVPYGVDVDAIDRYAAAFDRKAARERHGLGVDATVLLCVGTVEERKGQACLIEAFSELAAAHPSTELVLVGDQPVPYSAALHELIDALPLSGRARLVPTTTDIWEWYALSDVLVSASDIESMPRSMLEAMAFGVPVLAAAVFGVPELVHDGENGWLCEARDMRALTSVMRRVLGLSAEERQRAGAAGRRLVGEHHRSPNYARSYIELFGELVAEARQGGAD